MACEFHNSNSFPQGSGRSVWHNIKLETAIKKPIATEGWKERYKFEKPIVPGQMSAPKDKKMSREDSRRGTLTSTPMERERRATLVAALDDVRDTADIELESDTSKHKVYTVQILGTDLSKQPGEKAFTVR